MFPGLPRCPELAALAVRQDGVVARAQLAKLGVTWSYTQAQIDAQRWRPWARQVVVFHNAQPTRRQWMWIATLDAGPAGALASHSALEVFGFRGFAREASLIHVLVPRGAKYGELAGVQVHESRRFREDDVTTRAGIRCTGRARSAIDAGAWQPWPRFACAMLAAAVQQRMCTPQELDQTLAVVGRVRHKQHMRSSLRDIAEGAHALGEVDVARLCRLHALAPPSRQKLRRDATGRVRYLDCEWDLEDGSIVVLEVDGSHHFDVEHWEADMKRERKIVVSRRWVLRASNFEVRYEHAGVAADLIAMGVPRIH